MGYEECRDREAAEAARKRRQYRRPGGREIVGGILAVGCCFGGLTGVVLGATQAVLLAPAFRVPAEHAYQVSAGCFMAVLGAVAIGAGLAIFRSVL